MQEYCLERPMKEGFIAEWHDLDADFLYSVPFLLTSLQ